MKYLKKIKKRYKSEGIISGTAYYFKLVINTIKMGISLLLNRFTDIIVGIEKRLPIRDSIVFECESDMDDNPRALYEYLLKIRFNRKHKFIWIVNNPELCRKLYSEKNVKFYNRNDKGRLNQIRLNYYLGTSKFFFFSHPYWFNKTNPKQCVVNLWHGTPAKGPDLQNGRLKNCFDFITISNKNIEPFFSQFVDFNENQVLYCGIPRNDYLTENNINKINEIKTKINISSDERIILCMPTFKKSTRIRDFDIVDQFSLGVVKSEEELNELNAFLKQRNLHIIVKLHPLQDMTEVKTVELSNIHYLLNSDLFEKKIILYELLPCSDALLTDFSSVYFDYLLLNKPVGFFTNLLGYSKRGAMVENIEDYMAGDRIVDFKSLLRFIDDLYNGNDSYEQERLRLNNFFNSGNYKSNSEKITEIVLFNGVNGR